MNYLRFYVLGLITLLLSSWEMYAQSLNFMHSGKLNVLVFVFLLSGIIGAVLCFLKKLRFISRWLLLSFYSLQLVFIYSENFVFKFVASFAFPIHYFVKNEDSSQQVLAVSSGLGLNLFALIMLFFVIKAFKKEHITKSLSDDAQSAPLS